MKPNYLELIREHNGHRTIIDEVGLCNALDECYQIGKKDAENEIFSWLSQMNYLSDNITYIIDEWKNQKK